MERTGDEVASKFINALTKSLQNLCHGYLDFQNGIEIIGHINLSVDKGHSLDYILKEKVCKNAENSTSFISNSFHAEPKPENKCKRSNGEQNSESTETEKLSRLSSSSNNNSSLSGSQERLQRSSDAKESHSLHSQHRTAKRRASVDQSGEFRPAKVSHVSSESSYPQDAASPSRSQMVDQGPDDETSETLLPQTASVTDSSDIGVNLAGSVLEPVENQASNDRDDDSDADLEVTFIKEEYADDDNASCDFESSGGHPFPGGPFQREAMSDPSCFPVGLHPSSSGSATFIPGSFDPGAAGQYLPGSSSQSGSSGMRGGSGVPSFVNSLSAFGSLGAPGLPLGKLCGSPATSRQNRMLSKSSGSKISAQRQVSGYSKSHSSLQRAFALHREDKRRRQEEREEDMKQRLELMSELLALKGVSSAEDYKAALIREKRRVSKKLYRASLPEVKKNEIKEKDKLHKRMKRAARWAVSTVSATSAATQQFSDCSSDVTSGKDFGSVHQENSPFTGNFTAIGTMSVRDACDKGHGSGGSTARFSSDSSRIASRIDSGPSSDGGIHGMDSVECDGGLGSGCAGNTTPASFSGVSRLGSASAATVPNIGSASMERFSSSRSGPVSTASMVFGAVGNVPWIDSVSFDTGAQDQRNLDSDSSQREGYNLLKLSQR